MSITIIPDCKCKPVIAELMEALQAMLDEKAEYMRKNHLGDPMRETVSKIGYAAIAKAKAVRP